MIAVCFFVSLVAARALPPAAAKSIPSLVGPYIAYVNIFLQCAPGESEEVMRFYLRTTHFNPMEPAERQNITGNATFDIDLDDAFWMKVRLDLRSNNQWKENFFVFNFPGGGCNALRKNIPDFFHVMFKLKDEHEARCIIPKGEYVVNDEPVDWAFPSVPQVPYGRYRFAITFGKGKDKHMCFMADTRTIPKL